MSKNNAGKVAAVVGVASAVAAAGTAAAVMLSDKKNRRKTVKLLKSAKDQGDQLMTKVNKVVEDLKSEALEMRDGLINNKSKVAKKAAPKKYSESAMIDTVAAGSFATVAQPAIMPALNFQTAVLQNPGQSVFKTGRTFFAENGLQRAFAGSVGRAVCQGPRYAIGFGLMKWFKNRNAVSSAAPAVKESDVEVCYGEKLNPFS